MSDESESTGIQHLESQIEKLQKALVEAEHRKLAWLDAFRLLSGPEDRWDARFLREFRSLRAERDARKRAEAAGIDWPGEPKELPENIGDRWKFIKTERTSNHADE